MHNQKPQSGHLNDGLHDGALGRDGLGVRLIVALALDQVYQLVGQVNVGLFQRVGSDRPQGTGFRCVVARDTRSESLFPTGTTNRRVQ
mgnify:CR=1 FL=1